MSTILNTDEAERVIEGALAFPIGHPFRTPVITKALEQWRPWLETQYGSTLTEEQKETIWDQALDSGITVKVIEKNYHHLAYNMAKTI